MPLLQLQSAALRAGTAVAMRGGGSRQISRLLVGRIAGERSKGRIIAGTLRLECDLGRAGLSARKHEGDGTTPIGRFRLLASYRRPDQFRRIATSLALGTIRPDVGWCDDPTSRLYNRQISVPSRLGHERLWRDDRVYDLVIILDYNIRPRILGRGSAIFFHLSREDRTPTAGCVAIRAADMRKLLPRLGPTTRLDIR